MTVTVTDGNDSGRRLNYWQASALLVADCLGVGILALPQDVHALGWGVGLGFLLLNLPINFHAGVVLADAALQVEANEQFGSVGDELELTEVVPTSTTANDPDQDESEGSDHNSLDPEAKDMRGDGVLRRKSKGDGLFREKLNSPKYASVPNASATSGNGAAEPAGMEPAPSLENDDDDASHMHHQDLSEESHNLMTSDFIGITSALFRQAHWTYLVIVIYMLNLTLVLGDYVLVMSHAVTAMVGENVICLPTAGILASILMFGLSQLNTMALLGREVSILSLLAAVIILVQCLVATHQPDAAHKRASETENDDDGPFRKFSALASIGFAIGSQKLFLNIRHEMQDRREAHKTLLLSLVTYGAACVAVTLAAGPDPPSFLFDAIPPGTGRRVAGFLLWGHVAVSYAINSQALCSSMDRLFLQSFSNTPPQRRWILLTLAMTLFSYLVSNAIPFFKDLVALIGALTSVPLSLTLPLLIHRKAQQLALFCLDKVQSLPSYVSLLYSLVFLVIGLVGSLSSIERDWRLHGRPFSCH